DAGNSIQENNISDALDTVYTIQWFEDSLDIQADASAWSCPSALPVLQDARAHLNLWLFQGRNPQSQASYEIIIKSFVYTAESSLIENPLVHWNMDEGSGLLTNDNGDGQHHAAILDATWSADVNHLQFIDFDGDQDALVAADGIGLDATGDKTYMWWMKVQDPDQDLYSRIISKKNAYDDNDGYEIVYHPLNNQLQFIGQGAAIALADGVNLNNQWHHVSVVLKNNTAQFYVDGSAVTMTAQATGTVIDNVRDLYIGRMVGGYGDYHGSLDDMRIYDAALNAAQLLDIYIELAAVAQ
ncbi:MAG: LamG domain-containing protein, partial [Planctomycetes bacterium]|nr:LamG domain-containing protein [Planctomycetota bacterium]